MAHRLIRSESLSDLLVVFQPTGWEFELDSIEVLLETAESALNKAITLAHGIPLFVGGRSMSSQITTLLASQGRTPSAEGAVAFVFPMKWRELLPDPTNHFADIDKPMLFVQGDRTISQTMMSFNRC